MSTSKFDIAYMKMAEAQASLSYDKRKVGCILVKDNFVIAGGYNGTPRGTDNDTRNANDTTKETVIHAEMNALMQAARSNQSTIGAKAYTTFYPCLKCAIHLYQAGITEIYYKDSNDNPDQVTCGIWINETPNIKLRKVEYESNTEDTRVSKK